MAPVWSFSAFVSGAVTKKKNRQTNNKVDNNNTNNNSNNNKLDLEYKVNQYNIIIDVLGGYSKEVEKNIKELVGDKCESIMRQMQKAILSSSLHIVIGLNPGVISKVGWVWSSGWT